MTEEAKSPTPAPEPEPAKKKPAVSRARKWRKRLTWLVVVVVLFSLISRVIIVFALPPVLRRVARGYGLDARYESIQLYLLDGDVGIWHFTLSPIEGGDPILQSEYSRCDISTFDLLRGKLTIHRLESEGVDLLVERKADGTIPLLQRLAIRAGAPVPGSAVAGTPSPRSIDLTSPLRIEAFRLSGVHAHFVDAAVTPGLDTRVDLNLRITDVGSSVRPTYFELDMSAPPVLDLLHVEGTGTSLGKTLDAAIQVQAHGLHPQPAAGYLTQLGIKPTARSLSLAMNVSIKTHAAANHPNAIAGSVTLDGIRASDEGQDVASVDKITLNADAVDFTTALIGQIIVQGAHCQAERDRSGLLGIAGFELVPASGSAVNTTAAASSSVPFVPPRWGLGQLQLHDLSASLHDRSVAPPTDLSVHLADLTVGSVSPDSPDAASPIRAHLALPGIIDSIDLAGSAKPLSANASYDLKVSAAGIRFDALRPYLDAVGLESEYTGGTFGAEIKASATPTTRPDGIRSWNASVANIDLKDKADFFSMGRMEITGVLYDPAQHALQIKSVDISGPQLSARREATGAFSGFGFHTKARIHPAAIADNGSTASDGGPATPNSGTPITHANLALLIPKINLDRLTWKDVRIKLDDLAVDPPSSIETTDAGVELKNIQIDLDPRAAKPPTEPGQIHAWLVAPNLARSLDAAGTIEPGTNGIALDMAIDGQGITSDAIATYFQDSRIRPILHDGNLHLQTHLDVLASNDTLGGAIGLKDFSYKDGSSELLAVESADISGILASRTGVKIDAVIVKTPRLAVSREQDGSLNALGVRVLSAASMSRPRDRLDVVGKPRAATDASDSSPGALPYTASLKAFDLDGALVHWTDSAVAPAASANLTISASAANIVLDKSAAPATLKASVHEEKALDQLTVAGTFTPSLDSPSANLEINAAGIRAGDLGTYTGSAARVNLADGRFHAIIDAALSLNPAGGRAGHLFVNDLEYRDGAAGPLLCRIDGVRISASRIDPAGRTIAIDEFTVTGFETTAARSKDGTFRAMGLTFGETASGKTSVPIAQNVPVIQNAPPASSRGTPAPNAGDTQKATVAELAGLTQKKYPLITLDKLSIDARSVSVTDESRPDAAPIALSNLHVANLKRIELLGDEPTSRGPVDLQISGAIDPVVASMQVHAVLLPFADKREADIDIKLAGIRGSEVTDLIPELKSDVDGKAVTDGRFDASLKAQMTSEIRDPLNFDFSGGFGLTFDARQIAYRGSADGPILAGVDEISAEDIRVQPKTKTITVPDIEITKPRAIVFRQADGIHALGYVIKIPQAGAAAAATGSATPPGGAQTAAPILASSNPLPVAVSTTTPVGEMTIRKLIVSGLDFDFEDHVCDPPLLVPLNDLDLEVSDLSSRMMSEDKPVRFNALVNAGKVPIGGAIASATTQPGASSPAQMRDLFSQAEASGVVSLYPQPKGWVKTSLSALDLSPLKGEATAMGFDLDGGTFDTTTDLRLNGDVIDAHSRLVLTDLKVKEPPHGPITHFLGIDVPLGLAIGAVQDADGSITIPVDIPIKSGEISRAQIVGAGVSAVASVITTAVASAPLKVADIGLSLFGGSEKKKEEPITLTFDPASSGLGIQDVIHLQQLLTLMRDDSTIEVTLRGQLGGADVSRAGVLANPSADDCRNLAYRLRGNKLDLLAAREAATQRARAQLASAYGAGADDAIGQVAAIDRALAADEDALDNVYDMLRPGAERQADRRTRAACLRIAQDRIDAVKSAMISSGIGGIDKRITATHAAYSVADGNGPGTLTIVLTHKKGQ